MLKEGLFRLSQDQRLRTFITQNRYTKLMSLRFVPGEDLGSALAIVRNLNSGGMTATLDHLGENVTSESEAEAASDAYCLVLSEIAKAGVQCNVSLKLTHMGLDLGEDVARANVTKILEEAHKNDNFVRIDMESSEYVDRALHVFSHVYEQHKNVGTVLQANLRRSGADLVELLKLGARVRLVKGAYLEPPAQAFQKKVEVDAHFVSLMETLLVHGSYPAIATHDPKMIEAARKFAAGRGISPDAYEFQMLYGIRRDLQVRLVSQGHRVRIYTPFGSHWYPYLTRRMAERPANVMFVVLNVGREALASRRGVH